MKKQNEFDVYFREEFLTYQITEADRKMKLARKKLHNCYMHKKKGRDNTQYLRKFHYKTG